jgi:hypothetical protein
MILAYVLTIDARVEKPVKIAAQNVILKIKNAVLTSRCNFLFYLKLAFFFLITIDN